MKSDNICYDLYLHVDTREWWLWTDDGSGSVFHKGADMSKLQEKVPSRYFNQILWEAIEKASVIRHQDTQETTVRLRWTPQDANAPHYRFL